MTKDWIKLDEDKNNYPEANTGVQVCLVIEDEGGQFVHSIPAHHEEKAWFVYDVFEHKFRPLRQQQHVKYWKPLDYPRDLKDARNRNEP